MRTGLWLVLACGCPSSSSPVDIAKHPDLSVFVDMATVELPDLFTCGSRSDTGVESKSVLSIITAPQDRMQFGLDLNFDGKVDNQYGNITGALTANNLDTQPGLTAAVAGGQDLVLIDLTAGAFDSDPCVRAQMLTANTQASPDFSGNGSFTVDTQFAPSAFPGSIAASHYTSDFQTPVAAHVQLPFAGVMVPVDLVGARLQFTISPSGTPMTGQLNGAIKATDLQTGFIPGAAQRLDAVVTANPTSAQSISILQIFDIGCSTMPALAHDGHVATCEVGDNAIIKNVLFPDVQLFDAAGNYAPNPANTNKDSLSVGLGFTAVKATF